MPAVLDGLQDPFVGRARQSAYGDSRNADDDQRERGSHRVHDGARGPPGGRAAARPRPSRRPGRPGRPRAAGTPALSDQSDHQRSACAASATSSSTPPSSAPTSGSSASAPRHRARGDVPERSPGRRPRPRAAATGRGDPERRAAAARRRLTGAVSSQDAAGRLSPSGPEPAQREIEAAGADQRPASRRPARRRSARPARRPRRAAGAACRRRSRRTARRSRRCPASRRAPGAPTGVRRTQRRTARDADRPRSRCSATGVQVRHADRPRCPAAAANVVVVAGHQHRAAARPGSRAAAPATVGPALGVEALLGLVQDQQPARAAAGPAPG